ncbi:MAG: Cbp1 family collagen-binding glycoprotein adhesin [Candidatus Latescibacterota bacterium]
MNETPSQQPAEEKESRPAGTGTVKKYVVTGLILLLLATVFFMYRNLVQKNRVISSLQQENILGEEEQKKLNAYIEDVTLTINSVESKLQDVRNKQVNITGLISQAENDDSKKTQLLQDISVIEDQLKKDKRDIADLQNKMKKSNVRIKLLDDMVANLQKEIEKNEKSMVELRGVIEEKDRVIAEKEGVIKSKEDSLDYANKNLRMVVGELEQTNQLLDETKNTAYYVIGDKKDLLAKNVLEETGGFLRKKLNISGNFDKAAFTRIHIARESEFPVNCRAKDVQIMPSRAADTYTLEPAGENACVLKVTNPEQFWKMQYLVILVKG